MYCSNKLLMRARDFVLFFIIIIFFLFSSAWINSHTSVKFTRRLSYTYRQFCISPLLYCLIFKTTWLSYILPRTNKDSEKFVYKAKCIWHILKNLSNTASILITVLIIFLFLKKLWKNKLYIFLLVYFLVTRTMLVQLF